MGFATVNDLDILAGTVCLPRAGVWHADLEADASDATALVGAVTVVIGSLTLKGTAFRSGAFVERAAVRVVGGAAGFAKSLAPKGYRAPTVQIVAKDILGDAGEALSSTVDAALVATQLPAWVRMAARASEQFGRLVDHLGVGWRVLADGTVWFGAETWPTATLDDTGLLREWPEQARAEYAVDDFSLLPATTLGGRQVDYVEHAIVPDELRTRVWYVS